MNNKIQTLLLLFFLFFINQNSLAQTSIEFNPPEFVAPCGHVSDYQFTIFADNATTLNNAIVSYQLPLGLEYIPGSFTSLTPLTEDFSELSHPVFTLGDTTTSSFNITFSALSLCALKDAPLPLNDALELTTINQTDIFTSPNYNKNIPLLQVNNCSNLGVVSVVGDSFIRSCEIINAGFAPVKELYLTDDSDVSVLEILPLSGGTIVGTNPLIVRYDSLDFTTVGNGDGILDIGESFIVEETVTVLTCGNGEADLRYAWGCGGDICEEFAVIAADVSRESNIPKVEFTGSSGIDGSFCYNGSTNLTFTNNGSEVQMGAANAFDVEIELLHKFLPSNGFSDCIVLGNFQTATGIPLSSQTFNTYDTRISFDLTTDPDGASTGLEDLDGDGFFDDLAIGESITVDFTIDWEHCDAVLCENFEFKYNLETRPIFEDSCEDEYIPEALEVPSIYHHLEVEAPIATVSFSDNSLVLHLNFEIYRENFFEECPDGYMETVVIIPEHLAVSITEPPIYRSNPSGLASFPDYEIEGDTLRIFNTPNKIRGHYYITFYEDCIPPDEPPIASICSAVVPATIEDGLFQYSARFYCDAATCAPFEFYCDEYVPYEIVCFPPGAEIDVDDWVINNMSLIRTTFGWSDTTFTSKVEPDLPGLALGVGMPFDTFFFETNALLVQDENYDTTILEIVRSMSDYQAPLLRFVDGSITLFDVETGETVECSYTEEDAFIDVENNDYVKEISFLEMLETGNCWEGYHITLDDQIYLQARFVVIDSLSGETDASALITSFNMDYLGDTISCATQSESVLLVNPEFTFFSQMTGYNGQACDDFNYIFYMTQGSEYLSSNDLFPYEYRPVDKIESFEFRCPEWLEILPGTSTFSAADRPNNAPTGTTISYSVPLSDPIIVEQTSSQTVYRFEDIPASDFNQRLARSRINFSVQPHCLEDTDINCIGTYFVEDAYYTSEIYEGNYDILRSPDEEYRATPIDLNSNNPVYSSLTDTAQWELELCYFGENSQVIPNHWFYLDLPPNYDAIPVSFIENLPDGGTFTHEILPVPNSEDYWVQTGDVSEDICRPFVLRMAYYTCEDLEMKVSTGFACDGYPDSPLELLYNCNHTQDEVLLYLYPQESELQMNLTSPPPQPTALCENLPFEFKIINGGLGGALEPLITVDLPATGLYILPGTSYLRLPNGQEIPLPEPTAGIGSQVYLWNLSSNLYALAGINSAPENEFFFGFDLITDCSYDPNVSLEYQVDWRDACGTERETDNFFSLPLELLGAPESINAYTTEITANQLVLCAENNNLTVRLDYLGGSADNLTQASEKIRLEMPEGLQYQPFSLVNIENMPVSEPSVLSENPQILEWSMPVGLSTGSVINFSIGILPESTLDCGILNGELSILLAAEISCSTDGFCVLEYRESLTDFTLEFVAPQMNLELTHTQTIPINSSTEMRQFDILLQNAGDVPSAGFLNFSVYLDSDFDGVFSSDTDQFVENYTINGGAINNQNFTIFPYELQVPLDLSCAGIFIFLEEESNPCLCSSNATFLAPVLPTRSEIQRICIDNTLSFGNETVDIFSYQWTPTNYLAETNMAQTTFNFSDVINAATGQTETYYLETTRPGGCSSIDTFQVELTDLTTEVNLTAEVLCFGEASGALELTIKGTNMPYNIDWANLENTGTIAENLPAGQYEIYVSDTLGCTDFTEINIGEPQALGLTLEADSVLCFAGSDGNISSNSFGGSPPYQYDWNNGSDSPNLQNITAGNYNLILTDANNCIINEDIGVGQPTQIIPLTDFQDPTCRDSLDGYVEILFPISPNYTYSFGVNNFGENTLFENLGIGEYSVFIRDEIGCEWEETFKLEHYYDLLVECPADTTVNLGDSILLVPTTHPSVTEYLWTPPLWLSCDTCKNTRTTPLEHMEYTLTVRNSQGCEESDQVNIFIKNGIYAPNAFSPNGDGINDNWTLFSSGRSYHIDRLLIFDRWGENIWEQRDFPPDKPVIGWDGLHKGQEMNPQVLVYEAWLTLLSGEKVFVYGDITLVR